jgi:protein SCO1/2
MLCGKRHITGLVALLLGMATVAWGSGTPRGAAAALAAEALQPVRFEQEIGETLPLDVNVRDETDTYRRLRTFFDGRPVVLLFGYTRCPELCSVVADSTVETLRHLAPSAGRDFNVLYVSIDPTDTMRDLAALKRRDVRHYGRTGAEAGWHVLTGDARTIDRVTAAAGFHFTYEPQSKQFAHPSGFVVVTPTGVISRYFFGVDFDPKDVVAALRRAQDGKTGESVFALLLRCAHGGAISGKYGRLIWSVLELFVFATVGALILGIAVMLRQERRQRVSGTGVAPVALDKTGRDARATSV